MPRYLSKSDRVGRISKTRAFEIDACRLPASPLASLKRSKSLPIQRQESIIKALQHSNTADDSDDEDTGAAAVFGSAAFGGKIVTTFNAASVQTVPAVIQYALKSMFSELPERAGMNSVRISQVLNFQRNLPPLISLQHIHAIISASSRVERDIQNLLTDGTLLKLKIIGRGNDVTGLSELLVLKSDYERLLKSSQVASETVSTFLDVIRANPRSSSVPSHQMRADDSDSLLKAGFLVSPSLLGSRNLVLSGSSVTGIPTISRAASGSWAAIGGGAAFEKLGGVGIGYRSKSESHISTRNEELALSIPNTGAYLRLLDAARKHVIELLHTFKHKQAPLYLLRERWDGAIDSDNRISQAKQLRGEFSQVTPAKTKKWRLFHGLNFDWALEECLGAGMIELFETHAVGLGIRSLV